MPTLVPDRYGSAQQHQASCMDKATMQATLETLQALPAADRPYGEYDLAVIREILTAAELDALEGAKKGKGNGGITLQRLLKAYETVLPKHGVMTEEDVYYYRFLLKISLDPDPDWWAKFKREAEKHSSASIRAHSVPPYIPAAFDPTAHSRTPANSVLPSKDLQGFPLPDAYSGHDEPGMRIPAHVPAPTSHAGAPHRSAYQSLSVGGQPPQGPLNTPSIGGGANRTNQLSHNSTRGGAAQQATAAAQLSAAAVSTAYQATAPDRLISLPGLPTSGRPAVYTGAGLPAADILPNGVYPPQQPWTAVGSAAGQVPYVMPQPYIQARVTAASAPRVQIPVPPPAPAPVPASAHLFQPLLPVHVSPRQAPAASWPTAQQQLPTHHTLTRKNGMANAALPGDHQGDREEEEEEEDVSAAYADFRRMATSFRTWHGTAAVIRASRGERDAAVENWLIAVSFWEVHLVKRCFQRWAAHKWEVLSKVLTYWSGSTLRTAFNTWKQTARHLRIIGTLSNTHCDKRLRVKAFRAWQHAVLFSKTKAQALMKAVQYWTGHTVQACFSSWKLYTERALIQGENADSFYSHHARKVLFHLWRQAAHKLTRHRLASDAIQEAIATRLRYSALTTWHGRWATRKRHRMLLSTCTTRMRNRSLVAALNRWKEFMSETRGEADFMLKAIRFFHSSSLAKAWNSWRYLVTWQKDNWVLARQHAHNLLGYMQVDAFKQWRIWHARQLAKAEIVSHYVSHIQAGCAQRVLRAWHKHLLIRRKELQDFNTIMQYEVSRLKNVAWRRMHLAWRQSQHCVYVRDSLKCGRALRSLRHWRVLTHYKRQKRANHELALEVVRKQFKARLLHAWRKAAAQRVDHKRLVLMAHVRTSRRLALKALVALRQAVLYSAGMRMKELSAIMHWEQTVGGHAWQAWRSRTMHWRRKTTRWNKATCHYKNRLMDMAFVSLLSQQQLHQDKVSKALLHLTFKQNQTRSVVMKEWRAHTVLMSAKHNKVRRALAHWIASVLLRCWSEWRILTLVRRQARGQLTAAIMHWYRGILDKAFGTWRDWALYKVQRNMKAIAYFSVLCGRSAAYALLMLRAHAVRKRRSRQARAWHLRRLMLQALTGWRHRLLQAKVLQLDLMRVFNRMLGATVRQAFSVLRWYTLRKQMGRALALKYTLTFMQRAVYSWHQAARYSRQLRLKWTAMLGRTQAQMLRDSWTSWHEWLQLKRQGNLENSKAVGHLKNWLLGKAWNSWREHHEFCGKAKRVLRHMLNRHLAGAFNAWWGAVEDKRQVMDRAHLIVIRMLNRSVATSFGRLRANVVWQAKKRVAAAHFFNKTARQVLRVWHMTAKLQLAINLWTGNRLGMAWAQWRSLCDEKKRLRITSHTVAKRWLNMFLSTAWRKWREFTLEQREFKLCARKALGHWLNRSLASCWQAWREYQSWRSEMRLKSATLVHRLRNTTLQAAWNSWLEQMYFRSIQRKVLLAFTQKTMRAAFNTWRDLTSSKVHATRTAEQLFASITTMLASEMSSGVFKAWRTYTARMRRLRSILQKVLGRHMELGFHGWREVVQDEKQQRSHQAAISQSLSTRTSLHTTCTALLTRWARWDLAYPFHTWLWKTREQQQVLQNAAAAVFTYVGGLLRKAFMSWRQHTLGIKTFREKTMIIVFRMGGYKLGRAFFFWACLAPYLKHMRHAMDTIHGKICMRAKRNAWDAWQYRLQYSRIARKAIAQLAFKTLREALHQWLDATRDRQEKKQKILATLCKLQNRTLASAFATWRDVAVRSRGLKLTSEAVVRRLQNLTLLSAWNAWKDFMAAREEVRMKLDGAMQHWSNLSLSRAFNTWVEYWRGKVLDTLADVQYWGRLLDNAWNAWLDFVEDAVVMRGLEANRLVVFKTVLDRWKAFTADAHDARQLSQAMQALLTMRCLGTWRQLTQARHAMRRLYMRRALVGWYQRVLHLHQQREKLMGAAQLLMFGSYARCFRSWAAYCRDVTFKRAVFANKQAAIKEALRIGDQIRATRNAELLDATFKAWRFQVGVFRKVAKKFGAIMQRGLSSAFREWRDYVVDIRAANNRALEHFRRIYQERYLLAWRHTAASLATRSAELLDASLDHWYTRCVQRSLRAWREHVSTGRARRQALLKVLQSQVAGERKEVLMSVWGVWKGAVTRRSSLMNVADLASKTRRQRVMSEVFTMWYQYAQAMRADVDPSSPFSSPRSAKQDRRLVKRMAAMMGSTEVDAGSDASSDLFGDIYQTDRMASAKAALAHRHAYSGVGHRGDDSSSGSESAAQSVDELPRHAQPGTTTSRQAPQHAGVSYGTPQEAGRFNGFGATPYQYIAPSPVPFRGVGPTPGSHHIHTARDAAQGWSGGMGPASAAGQRQGSKHQLGYPVVVVGGGEHTGTGGFIKTVPDLTQGASAAPSAGLAGARSSILDRAMQRGTGQLGLTLTGTRTGVHTAARGEQRQAWERDAAGVTPRSSSSSDSSL